MENIITYFEIDEDGNEWEIVETYDDKGALIAKEIA